MTVSLDIMNGFVETLSKLRAKKEEAEEVVKGINSEIKDLEGKIISALDAAQMTSYKSPFGMVMRTERNSYATPKTHEEKDAFESFLLSMGGEDLLKSMRTFNSMTLNSYLKGVLEKREEDGDLSKEVPGLGLPSTNVGLSFRQK